MPWTEREQRLQAMCELPVARQNPILAVALPNLPSAERSLRDTATLVRLLRCAVAWRLGDRTLQLADPLGSGPLRVQQAGDTVHFVSTGRRNEKPMERAIAIG